MSIAINFSLFIIALLIGCLIVKAGWRLKYLLPLCFTLVFVLVLGLNLAFPVEGKAIQFLYNGKLVLNEYALEALSFSAFMSGLATFLLALIVLAIKHDVF